MIVAPSRMLAGAASRALSMSACACAHALVEAAMRARTHRAIRFIHNLQLTIVQILRADAAHAKTRLRTWTGVRASSAPRRFNGCLAPSARYDHITARRVRRRYSSGVPSVRGEELL